MSGGQFTQRERNIIEQIELVWQFPREISTQTLTQITEMVLRLPKPFQSVGLHKLAKYATGLLNLHVLSSEAQRWLYELPGMYQQEHLVVEPPTIPCTDAV